MLSCPLMFLDFDQILQQMDAETERLKEENEKLALTIDEMGDNVSQ